MGATESVPSPVLVLAAPVAHGEDEDLVALKALRPYRQLMHTPLSLPFVAAARPQLPAVSLDPAPLVGLLAELHAPLRQSERLAADNQRVLQHNIGTVETLAVRVAGTVRRQRKDLVDCRAQCPQVVQLEEILSEARARLASAIDATERLRRMLPPEVQPPPFDSTFDSTLFAGASASPLSSLFGLPGIGTLSQFSLLPFGHALSAADSESDDELSE
ncbi:hypothetical protein T492DRAFT_469723 [Pavlovales sp. CCMP2436]|nr:hypothetical protein T492DRAFT_469723 [Pavlovales sp. CCMP2436]|mmetsp:Transcript_5922/g.15511  ORF Transcript_5922/g.15511 Transcript_5922/m.15511 type:complete len:217 (-) Transcript_5922:126-776(-)